MEKSAATKVTAQKTQTPIVAKLIMQNGFIQIRLNLHFYQIQANLEKGIISLGTKYHFAYIISLAYLVYHSVRKNARL